MPFAPGDILYPEDIDRMGVSLRRVAAQNLPVSAFTAVSWDTEDADTSAMFVPHATTGTTITIPTGGGGVWSVSATVVAAAAPTGLSFLVVNLNGADSARSNFADVVASAAITAPLNAGATITVNVYRTAAAATTMTGTFYAYRVAV